MTTPNEVQANEYRAYFTLVGDFDPAEITYVLGLQPSRFFRKGDPHPRTRRPRPGSRWSLDSRLDATEYIDKHVLDVLEQLCPASEALLSLRSKYDGWIQLVAYFMNGQAGVFLGPEIVDAISRLKLGLDFDPYDLLANEEGS